MKKVRSNGNNITKITSKGQITIPLDVRTRLNLKVGDRLVVNLEKEKVALKPLPKKSLEEIYGSLPVKRPIDFKKVREIMEEEAAEEFLKLK